mmetsp:Transcript_10708/g.17954  ORF Transcript_10708/g.17954 Transcript_10708/m.17954 type:complete len:100 (+) Transcript_10708:166-465(+)
MANVDATQTAKAAGGRLRPLRGVLPEHCVFRRYAGARILLREALLRCLPAACSGDKMLTWKATGAGSVGEMCDGTVSAEQFDQSAWIQRRDYKSLAKYG